MPAKTAKQQRFMGMCANPKTRGKAHGTCPPVDVAKEFAQKRNPRADSKRHS